MFHEKLTTILNDKLPDIPKVGQLSVGNVFAELNSDGTIWLVGQDLQRDGHPLEETSAFGSLINKFLMATLNSASTKGLILNYATQALNKIGLAMDLEDLQLCQNDSYSYMETNNEHLTDHQKEVLVDALAEFLKMKADI